MSILQTIKIAELERRIERLIEYWTIHCQMIIDSDEKRIEELTRERDAALAELGRIRLSEVRP